MYVRTLTIRNLRSFEFAELTLNHPGATKPALSGSVPYLDNVTLLLGNNGAGKTSVLRAIALGTLAPVLAVGSGYVPYALVRRVQKRQAEKATVNARVILHAQDGFGQEDEEEVSATLVAPSRGFTDRFLLEGLPPWQDRMHDEESPAFLVLGYSATRRVESGSSSASHRAKERVLRYRRVAGLFEEHMSLMSLSAWLPRLRHENPSRHREVVGLMNQLLPDMELLEKSDESEEPECLFRRAGSVLPYPALSDGYRAFISWVGDLLYHLHTGAHQEKLVDLRGIVLVDEVDLHLHPEWQQHIVPTLSRVLPRLQFILTSHSPLVVGTLSSRNVLWLEEQVQPDKTRVTQVVVPDEELYGLSADQILTSESFGLESTRDERFFEQLKDAAMQARDGGAEHALRFMRMVAGGAAATDVEATESLAGPSTSKPSRSKPGSQRRATAKRTHDKPAALETEEGPPSVTGSKMRTRYRRLMRGAEIAKVQASLVKLGLMTQGQMRSERGVLGGKTKDALSRFQKHHGVSATGNINARTRVALAHALKKNPPKSSAKPAAQRLQ